jgi:pimeloyl-ACP methyl ester carboxylesterase
VTATRVDRLDVGEVTLAVTSLGEGEPVVLLHGFPENSHSWRRQLPAIAGAGFRAVAPDLRGYGDSDRPAAVVDYAFPKLIGDVTGLAAALGAGPVHLVGHDWGGALAWAVAAVAPQALRSLTILNCPHPTVAALERLQNPEQQRMSWYMLLFQFEGVAERFLAADDFANLRRAAFDTAAPGTFSDADLEALIAPLRREGALTAALNWYRANIPPESWLPPVRELPPVTVPTLIVWGEEDVFLGLSGLERSAAMVQAQVRVERLPGVSHWVQQEDPEAVNRHLLAFLEEHRAQPRV